MSRLTAIIVLGLALYEPTTPLLAPTRFCVLAIPPAYVVRTAELQPLYCNHVQGGDCIPYQFGGLVISDAVPCD